MLWGQSAARLGSGLWVEGEEAACGDWVDGRMMHGWKDDTWMDGWKNEQREVLLMRACMQCPARRPVLLDARLFCSY